MLSGCFELINLKQPCPYIFVTQSSVVRCPDCHDIEDQDASTASITLVECLADVVFSLIVFGHMSKIISKQLVQTRQYSGKGTLLIIPFGQSQDCPKYIFSRNLGIDDSGDELERNPLEWKTGWPVLS